MKHQYDEPTMQAAIDAACAETCEKFPEHDGTLITFITNDRTCLGETPARLYLLKSALDHLPEPPPPVVGGKTPGQVNHDAVANGDYDTYKKWSELSERGKRDVERGASAVLAAFGRTKCVCGSPETPNITHREDGPCHVTEALDHASNIHKALEEVIGMKCLPSQMPRFVAEKLASLAHLHTQRDTIERENADKMSELVNQRDQLLTRPQLSTLRPIAEAAGKVPDGCVRYYFESIKGVGWPTQKEQDAHFADIRLPESKSPNPHPILTLAQDQIDATPAMQAAVDAVLNELIHEGGEMFQVTTAPWTPKVGDVVTLKSGGPKMTVNSLKDGTLCNYFDNDGRLHASHFPAATLTKADS